MDIVQIDDQIDITEDFLCKLNVINEKTGVKLTCHERNVYITPPSDNAKRMVKTLLRMSLMALTTPVEVLVHFQGPILDPIRREIEKTCVESSVEFNIKKKGILLHGNRKNVSEAKSLLEFLNTFSTSEVQSPTRSESVPSHDGRKSRDEFGRFSCDGTPKAKPKRREHTCPFCKKNMNSSGFRNHVVQHCKYARYKFSLYFIIFSFFLFSPMIISLIGLLQQWHTTARNISVETG